MQDNNNMKAGKCWIENSRGKTKVYAFNHQRRKPLHIGSIIGATYEAVKVPLRQPELSIALTQSELGAVEDGGAQYFRIVHNGTTYAISLQDFHRKKVSYFNSSYGYQWRVPLKFWEISNTTAPRTPARDNPVVHSTAPLWQQAPLTNFETFTENFPMFQRREE